MKGKTIKGSIAAFEKEVDNIESAEVQQEIVDIINKNNLKKLELTEKQQEEREKYFNGKKQIKKHREVSKKDNKKTSKIISDFIINNDLIKIMEEDRREKPAKNLKSKFFSDSPLSEEQFEYLNNGEGVDNKDVDGETGFF